MQNEQSPLSKKLFFSANIKNGKRFASMLHYILIIMDSQLFFK